MYVMYVCTYVWDACMHVCMYLMYICLHGGMYAHGYVMWCNVMLSNVL